MLPSSPSVEEQLEDMASAVRRRFFSGVDTASHTTHNSDTSQQKNTNIAALKVPKLVAKLLQQNCLLNDKDNSSVLNEAQNWFGM